MSFPQRGEVYWVALDPTVGTDIAKTRPAVIISNDVGNQYSDRVIVAPLTSQGLDRVYPFEVMVTPPDGGLTNPSKILLDQIRSVDKIRLQRRIGMVSPSRMRAVDDAIRLSLAV
jgi:mRNA interferase MazF